MNTDLSMDETAQVRQKHWAEIRRSPLLLLLVLFVIQGLVYAGTYWSMIQIWWRSETFAHGFLIFPISVYLIWSRRHQLRKISDQPDYRGLPFIALCGFIWLLARLADVLVIQQFAVIAMIPALVWTACGWRKAWAMAFPLSFLLFAVPAGEFLVPSMMTFTADFTVGAVRLTGIPVFREGLFFTLPSGSWSVVEACSGVRYIIASLTLGCLYAYLTYHSYWRRLVFILFALITPVIANGIRAYIIVILGHLSGMKLAVGVDHLIYGWIWFGVVMFILFWVGSFWRDEKSVQEIPEFKKTNSANSQTSLMLGLMAMSSFFIWPLWASNIEKNNIESFTISAPQSDNWFPADLWV
ncbi:MAG: exosortase A, partial [Pseudomonadales bacterium]|nr:exosortase A [Pseudomonadales bacterium]